MKSMRGLAAVVIPARLASKRFPGKLLEQVNGKSVLQSTYEKACLANKVFVTMIATDNTDELFEHAQSFCPYVYKTSDDIRCGTCRVAKLASHKDLSKADIIVNVQADEIDIDPALIDELIETLNNDVHLDMVTAVVKRPVGYKTTLNSTVRAVLVKDKLVDLVRVNSVCDKDEFYEHIGIAAFRKSALFSYTRFDPSDRDRAQDNEYLTAIDKGLRIGVVKYKGDPIAINTEEDLKKVKKPVKKAKKKAKKKATKKKVTK